MLSVACSPPPRGPLAVLGLVALLTLALLAGGCIDRRVVLHHSPPAPDPAWSLPSVTPSGDVTCWPRRTPFDQCLWKL